MPTMKGMGPSCCCCRDTLRENESRVLGGITGISLREVKKPDEVRELKLTHNYEPAGANFYNGSIAPDWYNKRIYYYYGERLRSGGGSLIGTDSHYGFWNGRGTPGPSIQVHPNVQTVGTTAGFITDALATDGENQHLYYIGQNYPGDISIDFGFDIRRMNYDATGQTLLASTPIYRVASGGQFGAVSAMQLNRTARRLYFAVRQNVTTSTSAEWTWDIRYLDLATNTVTTVYSVLSQGSGPGVGDTFIRLINSLSFDVARGKIYWCEQYFTAGSEQEGKVRRCDLDGTNVELLYQSTDPFAVSFARFSNSLDKIVHADRKRVNVNPRLGIWLRSPTNWNDEQLIALNTSAEILGSPTGTATSSFLWCGLEATGPGTKA